MLYRDLATLNTLKKLPFTIRPICAKVLGGLTN